MSNANSPADPGATVSPKPFSGSYLSDHVIKAGKRLLLNSTEWRKLTDSVPTNLLRDLCDRALIADLTCSFARSAAALRAKGIHPANTALPIDACDGRL